MSGLRKGEGGVGLRDGGGEEGQGREGKEWLETRSFKNYQTSGPEWSPSLYSPAGISGWGLDEVDDGGKRRDGGVRGL